jgi:integrase
MANSNPIVKANFPKKKVRPRKERLSTEEIKRWSRTIEVIYPRIYPAFLFCLKNPTGYGDLLELTCNNLRLETWTVKDSRQKTDADARPIIYPELRKYAAERKNGGHRLLFDLPREWSRHLFRKSREAAGIERNVRWHDLRHHAATWLAELGVPLHMIASIGGWKTIQQVEEYHALSALVSAQAAQGIVLRGEWPQVKNKIEEKAA